MTFDDFELIELYRRFAVPIPAQENNFQSFAQLDDYLCKKLAASPAPESPCPTARAFHQLCDRLAAAGFNTADFAPSSPTAQLLPPRFRKHHWEKLSIKLALPLPAPTYGPAFGNFARIVFVASIVVAAIAAAPFNSMWFYVLFLIPSTILCGIFLLVFHQLFSPLFRSQPPQHLSTLAGLAYLLAFHHKKAAPTHWTRPEVWAGIQLTFGKLMDINPRRIRRKLTFKKLWKMT